MCVYQWVSNSWVRLGGVIDGDEEGDFSGESISLSANGTRVAIGATHNDDSGNNSGHVCVYEFDNVRWVQIGSDIDGESNGDQSGYSISLSADGTKIAIGAIGNDNKGSNTGHVRVYKLNKNDWKQMGSDIDGEAPGDNFGCAISLNYDGTMIAIGGLGNDGKGHSIGHVRVFHWKNKSWVQLGLDIYGENEYDYFGESVALSSNGKRLAIGSTYNDGNGENSGHVRVYEWNNRSWNQLGGDINGEAKYDFFGESLSLNSKGSILAVGSSQNDGRGHNSGSVRVFKFTGNNWNQIGTNIHGEFIGDLLGSSLSLSADGLRLSVGGKHNDSNGLNSGHIRVYSLENLRNK